VTVTVTVTVAVTDCACTWTASEPRPCFLCSFCDCDRVWIRLGSRQPSLRTLTEQIQSASLPVTCFQHLTGGLTGPTPLFLFTFIFVLNPHDWALPFSCRFPTSMQTSESNIFNQKRLVRFLQRRLSLMCTSVAAAIDWQRTVL